MLVARPTGLLVALAIACSAGVGEKPRLKRHPPGSVRHGSARVLAIRAFFVSGARHRPARPHLTEA
jgi:hypothetical protein